MALNNTEMKKIENAIDHLKVIYPNEMDEATAQILTQNLLNSGLEAVRILPEIYGLFKKDPSKLENFLTKYQVKAKTENQTKKSITIDKIDDFIALNEIAQIESATAGMTEQDTVQYLRSIGKNPQQITMIILALQNRRQTKIENKPEIYEKPKQMVLINPNVKQKMSGFVDALTLAFLVGTVSGTLFFAMLQLFIQHLK